MRLDVLLKCRMLNEYQQYFDMRQFPDKLRHLSLCYSNDSSDQKTDNRHRRNLYMCRYTIFSRFVNDCLLEFSNMILALSLPFLPIASIILP